MTATFDRDADTSLCDKPIGQLSMCDRPKGHTGPHHDSLSGVTE